MSKVVRTVCLVGLGLAVALWALWPALLAWPHTPTGEGELFLQQIEIGKASLRHYGEFPMWNAYDCHGIPAWDQPDAITGSPLLLLLTPFRATATYITWELFHVAAGFVGMWLLARNELGSSRRAALAASFLWALAPSFAAQVLARQSTLLDLYLAPLALFVARRGAKNAWHAVLLGFLLVFVLLEGAGQALPMIVLLLVVDALSQMSSVARAKGALASLGIALLVALTVGAFRWVPLAERLVPWPTQVFAVEPIQWPLWGAAFFAKAPPPLAAKPVGDWSEYVAYVGYPIAFIAGAGAILLPRGRRHLLVVAALMGAITLGHFHRFSPASLLGKLPLFAFVHPSSYRHIVVMFASVFLAMGVDQLSACVTRYKPAFGDKLRTALVLMALIGTGAAGAFAGDLLATHVQGPPPAPRPTTGHFYYGGGNLAASVADLPRHNRAWMGCRAAALQPAWLMNGSSPVWEGDVEQVKVAGGAASIETSARTPNSFRARVVATEPTRIVLNTAYDRGWFSNLGAMTRDTSKGPGALLAVDVPPGTHDLVVRYWPHMMTVSLLISAIALAVLALLWRRRRHRVRS